jgi:hypothetical protein
MPNPRRFNFRIACLAVFLAQAAALPSRILAGTNDAASPQPVTVPAKGGVEPVAAGLLINRRQVADLVIYKQGDDYWIPYNLFIEETGLRETPLSGQRTSYSTSVGALSFDKGELKVFENEPCISLSSLKKSFLVNAVFDLHLFAASLDVPWAATKERKSANAAPPVPDISAPAGSLSFLSIDTGIQRDFHGLATNSLQLQAGGRLFGGVWDINDEGDPSEQMDLKRYHWSAFSNHVALRLGTGTNLLSPEMVNNDFTGLQFGWNNRNIVDYLDTSGRSATDTFVSLNRNQNRSIEGNGPAAGIAELRFDGKIVARLRIKLDGRFVFGNVRMGSDLRRTEVYIYERSTEEKPVAILDYTQSVMNGSLPGGEMLVRGGFGRSGNPFITNSSQASTAGTGFVQMQYGLGDRITLDAGSQYNPVTDTGEFSAGSIFSLGHNWAASLYGTEANKHYGSDLRIEGHGKAWSLSYLSQRNDSDFGYVGALQQTQQWLRFTERPIEQATLLLYGRKSQENGIETRRFLLPGAFVSPCKTLRLSAVPNEDGHYRYEADHSFSPNSEVRVIHESGVASVEWNKNLSSVLKARFFNEYAFNTHSDLTGAYLDWYPRSSRFDIVELGASRSGKEYGFSGKWIRYLNTGLKVALQYSWNMAMAQNLITTNEYSEFIMPPLSRHFFACTVSWDLGFSGRHPFPIDRSAITTTRGGLAGRLDIAGDTKVSSSDINDVGILLDGRRLDQRQVDGSFFVGNLRPGLYTVSVDTENLPIELTTEKKRLLVEVKNGAVTNVNIPVHAMYGIDGRVVDQRGNGVGKAEVEVVDMHDTIVAMVSTNEFGEYRTDGLPTGNYRLRVAAVAGLKIRNAKPLDVSISKSYMSDVNLNVGEIPNPDKAVQEAVDKVGSEGT